MRENFLSCEGMIYDYLLSAWERDPEGRHISRELLLAILDSAVAEIRLSRIGGKGK